MTPSLRTLLASGLGLAVLALGACQDEDPESPADPTSDASTSAAPTDEPSEPTASSAESNTSPAAGGVAPATGPELHLRVLSVHAPEGFSPDDSQLASYEISASSNSGLLQLVELENAAQVSLEVAAKNFVKSLVDAKDVQRLPNVMLGAEQVEALRFSWIRKGTGDRVEAVQAYRDGASVSLTLTVTPRVHQTQPDVFESVLASAEWLV